jgi:hypothetical protein
MAWELNILRELHLHLHFGWGRRSRESVGYPVDVVDRPKELPVRLVVEKISFSPRCFDRNGQLIIHGPNT